MNTHTGDIGEPDAKSVHKLVDVALDAISILAEHEGHALTGHWQGLKTRWAVARKARTVGELLRDQIDLLPDTAARFSRDHALRRALIRGLRKDLRSAPQRAA